LAACEHASDERSVERERESAAALAQVVLEPKGQLAIATANGVAPLVALLARHTSIGGANVERANAAERASKGGSSKDVAGKSSSSKGASKKDKASKGGSSKDVTSTPASPVRRVSGVGAAMGAAADVSGESRTHALRCLHALSQNADTRAALASEADAVSALVPMLAGFDEHTHELCASTLLSPSCVKRTAAPKW
jgi:hypothetical protein